MQKYVTALTLVFATLMLSACENAWFPNLHGSFVFSF